MARDESTIHPGQFVRDSVLTPKKLTVSAAAKLVGVGRPAFSKFINGRVATTSKMASRIEVAFGISAEKLLEMQVNFDRVLKKGESTPTNSTPYVVPFLSINATDIEKWADRNISARSRLSVFLRILVNSTGVGLKKVDFPGNDDSERPGWDGLIECIQHTQWIPDDISGWEFGVNKDVKSKADRDFTKSVKATSKEERNKTTFVFVTPRYWPGKEKWIKEKKATGQWKDVFAYSSSDLEQWLEQSIPARVWFANETKNPSNRTHSLDYCWDSWAGVTTPPLSGSFFLPAIETARRSMLSRLSNPSPEPVIIAADSVDEGLAFLSQLFGPAGGKELEQYRDRVIVFGETGVLPKLALGATNFIAVATNREVELELGQLSNTILTIVLCPRNVTNVDPHIVLEPVNQDTFNASLEEMGYGRDEISKYINESGKSLTVLRRRLATIPAIRTPDWTTDHDIVTRLIPFLFVGAWNSANSSDQTALELVSDMDYEYLEKECQRFVGLNDSPLWSVGTYRGVISKIDLLFAIANSITIYDLERYFIIAKMILSEDDPKLDLPERERWAAAIHNISREFSTALREGISETLVLLAVHGNNLFEAHLGYNCECAVSKLVKELLTPVKTRILEANSSDLAAYAEAAPKEFLTILEEDLNRESPEIYGLMRPASSGIFGGDCPRSGLLWALEGLSWKPETLPRSALILSQLAEIEIDDNWANKPIGSLNMIFCIWMPQTAADHNTRLRVLELLVNKHQNVAWKICIDQIDTGRLVGHYSHKPKWRNDGQGFGEPFKTDGPVIEFRRAIIDLLLNWKYGYTKEKLCDLIQHLHCISMDGQAVVWELIKSWLGAGVSDSDKADVRETIRMSVLSQRGVNRANKIGLTEISGEAKTIYKSLEPDNHLYRHEWLFRSQWIELSADELHDDEMDYHKREKRITQLRIEALREIVTTNDLSALFELVEMGKASHQIGWLAIKEIVKIEDVPIFLINAFLQDSDCLTWARKNLLIGVLSALEDDGVMVSTLKVVKQKLTEVNFLQLLLLAPFRRNAWQVVDSLDTNNQQAYWSEVVPDGMHGSVDEAIEAVERLLTAQRPRAAFNYMRYDLDVLDSELLYRLMLELVDGGKDKPGQYQFDRHYIEKAFSLINKNTALTLEQKAGLEFAYIDVLSERFSTKMDYGLPNLEKYVELHPELFVQAIVWLHKRKDEGVDSPEWRAPKDKIQYFAKRGYSLLNGLKRIPGHDIYGNLQKDKLASWVKSVRDACLKLGRLDFADLYIGELLSKAPIGEDGVWPCEPVRQVMEDVRSLKMMSGANTGLHNSRGVKHGEGGNKERELADQYRVWANELRYTHPFVASELLLITVESYENEAKYEDTRADIHRRLY